MFSKKNPKQPGLSPGTIIHVGEKKVEKTKITVLAYDGDHVNETSLESVDACKPTEQNDAITWINISGIHDVQMIQQLGENFGLHPLVLEDIVNTEQRSKIDDYDDYIFIVLKMVYPELQGIGIRYEQVSFIVGPTYVISLQEVEENIFDPIRERIKKGKGRIRKRSSDYLAYALMDMVVDYYFKVLEVLGEHIGTLQDDVIKNPEAESLEIIQTLKKEVLFLRKSIWPLREIVNTIIRSESKLIKEEY